MARIFYRRSLQSWRRMQILNGCEHSCYVFFFFCCFAEVLSVQTLPPELEQSWKSLASTYEKDQKRYAHSLLFFFFLYAQTETNNPFVYAASRSSLALNLPCLITSLLVCQSQERPSQPQQVFPQDLYLQATISGCLTQWRKRILRAFAQSASGITTEEPAAARCCYSCRTNVVLMAPVIDISKSAFFFSFCLLSSSCACACRARRIFFLQLAPAPTLVVVNVHVARAPPTFAARFALRRGY